jgi:PEGA domain
VASQAPAQADPIGYASTLPSLRMPPEEAPAPPPVSHRGRFIAAGGLLVALAGLGLGVARPWASPEYAAEVDAGVEIAGKLDAFVFPAEDASAAVRDEVAPAPAVVPARLSITAPSAAAVVIDDQEVGSTPLTVELEAGEHEISVKGPGVDKKVRWQLKAGEVRTLMAAAGGGAIAGAKGSLHIDAHPFCSTMKVDGKVVAQGVSLKVVAPVALGAHVVECAISDPSLPAPKVKVQKVKVTGGAEVGVEFFMLADG